VRTLFQFPNPVNELAARTVAAGVVLLSAVTLVLSLAAGSGWLWLTAVLAGGFVARVATGPTLSPLGQLASRVIAPRLGPARLVPGPPKRFAQGLGAVMTVTAAGLHFGFGFDGAAEVFVGLIIVAATLESAFAICLGCIIFGALMKVGVIPASACEACNSVGDRLAALAPAPAPPARVAG